MIPPMQPNKSMSSLDGFRSNYSEPHLNQRRRACHCILATVCLLSVGVLAVSAAVVVRQYALSRSYEAATCRLANVTYDASDAECSHCTGTVEKGTVYVAGSTANGDRDRSPMSSQLCFNVKFPCVRIIVDFVARSSGSSSSNRGRVLLYSDTAQASGEHAGCSFSVCYATRDENARHVQEFVDRYEADSDRTFNCYYDTETKDNVIDHKAYTSSDVIHCLLWPSLILFVCAFVFIYIELKRRNIDGTPHETGFNGGRPPLQHRDSRGVSDGDVVLVAVNRPPTVQHPTRVSSHDERSRPTG